MHNNIYGIASKEGTKVLALDLMLNINGHDDDGYINVASVMTMTICDVHT